RATAAIGLLLLVSCATAHNYPDLRGPRFAGNYAGPPPSAPPAALTTVTFNIKFGRQIDRAIQLFHEAEPLRHPDLVTLQDKTERPAARMPRPLSMNYVYYPAAVHPANHLDFGNAILSRWPIVEDRKIPLPHPGRFRKMRRVAVAATLDVAGQKVRVYSVHL